MCPHHSRHYITIDITPFVCYNVSVNKEKRKQFYCVCEGRSVMRKKALQTAVSRSVL